jgi:transcriptional regulator with XRE-family HTH domain
MLLVKVQRINCGDTIRELAYRAGISAAEISMIEKGRLRPTPAQLAKLATALNVAPPERLLREVRITDVGVEEAVPARIARPSIRRAAVVHRPGRH